MAKIKRNETETLLLTDYELMNSISSELAKAYRQAVSMMAADCHCESLVNFRSCLSLLLNKLGYQETKGITLDQKIRQLNDSGNVNLMIPNLMHNIRVACNKGSHSENYPDEDFASLCNQTHQSFIKLIKQLYPKFFQGNKCPEIEPALEQEINIIAMSPKALFEDDSPAQYLVAKKLYSNAQAKLLTTNMGYANKETTIELDNGEEETRYHDMKTAFDITMAFHLFASCQYELPEASYEFGKLLLTDGHWLKSGSTEEHYFEEGVRRVHFAALHGITDALYFDGYIRMHALYGQSKDQDYAVGLLEEAAEKNHPKATYELGDYHYSFGRYELAKSYFVSAIELGSPKAQYVLAKNILDGTFNSDDEYQVDELLFEAANAGVTEARLLRARYLVEKPGNEFNPEIPDLYDGYLKKIVDAEVMLEYAQYLIAHKKSLDTAMNLLNEALSQARHTDQIKLAGLIGLILSKTEFGYDSGNFKIYFPSEAMLTLQDVELNTSRNHNSGYETRSLPVTGSHSKPGRNEPCYCGSGKKYKKCCLH